VLSHNLAGSIAGSLPSRPFFEYVSACDTILGRWIEAGTSAGRPIDVSTRMDPDMKRPMEYFPHVFDPLESRIVPTSGTSARGFSVVVSGLQPHQ
jgi:hypothetical protein